VGAKKINVAAIMPIALRREVKGIIGKLE